MSRVKRKILIVDDLAFNRMLLRTICSKLGYEVAEAQNGMECLDVYEREHDSIACIILDLQMPVLDGWATAQRLRELEAKHNYTSTLIVACTAADLSGVLSTAEGQSVARWACLCGANECIEKPPSLTAMQAILSKYIPVEAPAS